MRKCFVSLVSLVVIVSLILGAVSIAFAQQVKGPSPVMYNTLKDYEKATGKKITKFDEAPMLADLVKQGKLPPVEKRLPGEDTVVIKPAEEIGQYGGRIRVATTNPAGGEGSEIVIGYEPILRIGTDCKSIEPNIAKSWKFTEGGKVLTLYLRKGIKWSDGVPFTADDIMFWWEDVILNDELTPVKPIEWSPGGKLMEVKKIDDYTVQFRFAVPYYVATLYLAHSNGTSVYLPKHYFKQFHPKYTSKEKLETMCKEAGYDKWYQLFLAKKNYFWSGNPLQEPDTPMLTAFILKEKKPGITLFKRNPYYWKIDTAGNQLPYIDEVFLTLVENEEALNMKIVGGEIDFEGLHTLLENYPLYMENAKKGGYRAVLWQANFTGNIGLMFNLAHPDPVKRKIFQDRRFRIAVSLAINRDEMNKVIFFGKAVPSQATALPTSHFYEESFAKAYAEYNPKEANALLDKMGLNKRDKEGYRLMPDGRRLTITIEYWPGHSQTPPLELIKEYLQAVGLNVLLKPEERSFWSTRMSTGEHDASVWLIDKGSDILFPITPNWFVPISTVESIWGTKWALWYSSKGESGEEPPTEVKKLFDLYEKMKSASEKERILYGKQILTSQAKNLWCIGTVSTAPCPVIVSEKLGNVPPEGSLWGWDWFWMSPYHAEQLFFKK